MNPNAPNPGFQLPADGWIQLVPLGEFAHPSGVIQVLDREAVQAMANTFATQRREPGFSGLLFDYDHFSADPDKPSAAAAWIDDVAVRADGLYGRPRWTSDGRAAVEGGEYRFVSPVFPRENGERLGNHRLRPRQLLSVALTNAPNLRGMAPLSNRRGPAAPTARARPGRRRWPCTPS